MVTQGLNLSWLAPEPQPAEAITSWLARTAAAHSVTMDELRGCLGCPSVWNFERGHLQDLELVAAATRRPLNELRQMVPADLRGAPSAPVQWPDDNWAVCDSCLEEDVQSERAPYVRRWWTHPLATRCAKHGRPLIPYFQCDVSIVDREIIRHSRESLIYDGSIARWTFDQPAMLEAVERSHVDAENGQIDEIMTIRRVVGDLVDALAAADASGRSIINHFQDYLVDYSPRTFCSRSMPEGVWRYFTVADRLRYIRFALYIYADPSKPYGRATPAKEREWLRGFSPADPVDFLAFHSRPSAIEELSRRSELWPECLVERWKRAVALKEHGEERGRQRRKAAASRRR